MFNSKDDDEEITSRYGNMNTPTTYASDAMASSFERAPPRDLLSMIKETQPGSSVNFSPLFVPGRCFHGFRPCNGFPPVAMYVCEWEVVNCDIDESRAFLHLSL